MAMLKMFAPSASTPPSANRKHCTINTVVSTTIAALGPSKAAASTPPTRCPEVPPATGKLTTCAAKRNAAASHVEDVRPQRQDTAVREKEALPDQHRLQHYNRRAGAEQSRRQHAAHEMS